MDDSYFSAAELTFLKHHGLSAKDVYNAGSLQARDYIPKAEAAGKFLVLTRTKCPRNHALKTLGGHCPQCSPSVLAFERRHRTEGFIFVAYSKAGELTKVAVTEDIKIRTKTLNVNDPRKITDWVILYASPCKEMGSIEAEAHKELAAYRLKSGVLDARSAATKDLFRCESEVAINVVKTLLAAEK